ncbi:hypothetical protein A8924_7140 [Saccharopolyspora erythraea NRRL 2338]|uniref:Uncharacterized protein n=1 Tax=Saccharopolyspora erythraea TaxID=1836 RepID=A0ABP3MLZ5_SACER|nr:hypothetical protein [Saccharopolyspora erythraea]EQD84191.1 hypothetical protein N599_21370 [Saccharopolyspora erythraea D]PFG99590.1 hypothetical protein A8924_7140 [Saccharopolyspora erythraea NRRL 2338]
MAGLDDSVRRLRDALGTAVSRGRRARSDVLERSETFRARTAELGDGVRRGELRAVAESERARAAAEFRHDAGLPAEDLRVVAESDVDGSGGAAKSPESQEQTPSDGSDLDFSQAQILR